MYYCSAIASNCVKCVQQTWLSRHRYLVSTCLVSNLHLRWSLASICLHLHYKYSYTKTKQSQLSPKITNSSKFKFTVSYTLMLISKHNLNTHFNHLYRIPYANTNIILVLLVLVVIKILYYLQSASKLWRGLLDVHLQRLLWTVLQFVVHIAHLYKILFENFNIQTSNKLSYFLHCNAKNVNYKKWS